MCDPMLLPHCEGHFYSLPERMLKRLASVRNVWIVVTVVDFQYAHIDNGTEVSLKIVESGVRYRAQKRG